LSLLADWASATDGSEHNRNAVKSVAAIRFSRPAWTACACLKATPNPLVS
jgi:hypothetical protein